jgi:hypothetical protein
MNRDQGQALLRSDIMVMWQNLKPGEMYRILHLSTSDDDDDDVKPWSFIERLVRAIPFIQHGHVPLTSMMSPVSITVYWRAEWRIWWLVNFALTISSIYLYFIPKVYLQTQTWELYIRKFLEIIYAFIYLHIWMANHHRHHGCIVALTQYQSYRMSTTSFFR